MGNALRINQSVPPRPKRQTFLQAYWGKSIQHTDNLFGNRTGVQPHDQEGYISAEISLSEGTPEGSK